MKTHFILLTVLLSLLLFQQGAFANKLKEEVSKTVSEKYSADASTRLKLQNKYGKVHLNTWNKNEITVEVVMKAWASSKDKAQKQLDRLGVVYGKSGNTISFETTINDKESSSWFDWDNMWSSDEKGFEINYTVYMPIENALELSNKYGAVYLADFKGELNVNIKYGSLQANRVEGKNALIEMGYSNSNISYFANGSISSKYGNLKINEAGTAKIDTKYGNCEINKAQQLSIDSKYGNTDIREVETLTGSTGYGDFDIGELHKKLVVTVRYGNGVNVKKVGKNFEQIDIDSQYAACKLGFDKSAAFSFKVDTKYGGLSSRLSNMNFTKEIDRNTEEYYEGTCNGGKGGTVNIISKYGSVKFTEN
jgi:hypothetical protein